MGLARLDRALMLQSDQHDISSVNPPIEQEPEKTGSCFSPHANFERPWFRTSLDARCSGAGSINIDGCGNMECVSQFRGVECLRFSASNRLSF